MAASHGCRSRPVTPAASSIPYGGGLAKVLSESLPKVEVTAEVTAASVDNLKLIQLGKVDIAFTTADTLADAVHGRDAFEKTGAVRAQTLAILYPNYTHLVTVEGSGIERLADLRGKVVSTGSAGSGTEVIAFRVLRAAGLDPDRDIRRQALSVNASVDAHQGRQDRRLLLERRVANGIGARSGEHRWPHGEADRQ